MLPWTADPAIPCDAVPLAEGPDILGIDCETLSREVPTKFPGAIAGLGMIQQVEQQADLPPV